MSVVEKEGLAIYHQGMEDLVLRVGYQLTPLEEDKAAKKEKTTSETSEDKIKDKEPGDKPADGQAGGDPVKTGNADTINPQGETAPDKKDGDGNQTAADAKPALDTKPGDNTAKPTTLDEKKDAKTDTMKIDSLAWIVAVPSMPRSSGRIGEGVFDEADHVLYPKGHWVTYGGGRGGGFGGGGSFGGGGRGGESSERVPVLRVFPTVVEGEFAIQPLQADGPEGVQALQSWLKTNGFAKMPERSLEFYAQNHWTYLAIKVNLRGRNVLRSGSLPALRLSFPSRRIWFPILLAKGPIKARLYVLTDTPISEPQQALSAFGFTLTAATSVSRGRVPASMRAVCSDNNFGLLSGSGLYEYSSDSLMPQNFGREVSLPMP